jgi:plasmid stabilization system protein ParE
MVFSVQISAKAEADIDAALTWVMAQAPMTAQRWFNRLLAAVKTLESMPERCPLATEAADLGIELRELLFGKRRGTFRILFTVDASIVHVLHIRRATRGPITQADI